MPLLRCSTRTDLFHQVEHEIVVHDHPLTILNEPVSEGDASAVRDPRPAPRPAAPPTAGPGAPDPPLPAPTRPWGRARSLPWRSGSWPPPDYQPPTISPLPPPPP